jgi:hypothetical protein
MAEKKRETGLRRSHNIPVIYAIKSICFPANRKLEDKIEPDFKCFTDYPLLLLLMSP